MTLRGAGGLPCTRQGVRPLDCGRSPRQRQEATIWVAFFISLFIFGLSRVNGCILAVVHAKISTVKYAPCNDAE